jgi:hypothetical protein
VKIASNSMMENVYTQREKIACRASWRDGFSADFP